MKRKTERTRLKNRVIKLIVERHPDTYIAYPLGIVGACVSQGDTYEEALAEVKVMLKELVDIYGEELFDDNENPVMEAFVEEAVMSV
jgi:hypothetical protein